MGLIGGLGVGATVHYYKALAEAHEHLGRPLPLVMVNADVNLVLAAVGAHRLAELADYLLSLLDRLKQSGADIAAIPAATPHICFTELASRSPLPLVSMLQVAGEATAGKRVTLFGTPFTIETDFFGALESYNTISPQPLEIDQIHEAYVRTAKRGEGTGEDRRSLTALAHTLIARERLDAIVFAGTDLALLFNPDTTTFPFIDCAQLHVKEILKSMIS